MTASGRSDNMVERTHIPQMSLLNGGPPLKTAIIAQRGDFDSLFEGFETLRAVSYVASPDLILDFLTVHGFSSLEIVVGDNLTQSYREALASTRLEIVETLAERVEDGTLRILVPRRTIHSKLYILENTEIVRVINGSANLTVTAQQASNQINYDWYFDLPKGDPLINTFMRDYEAHTKRCSVFMNDLLILFKNQTDTPKKQLIEAWLSGATAVEESHVTKHLMGELRAQALEEVGAQSATVYSLTIPEATDQKRQAQRVLDRLGAKTVGNTAEVNPRAYFEYVEKTINVPFMAVDVSRGQVTLVMDHSLRVLNQDLPDSMTINGAFDASGTLH